MPNSLHKYLTFLGCIFLYASKTLSLNFSASVSSIFLYFRFITSKLACYLTWKCPICLYTKRCLDGRFGIGYTVFGVFLPVKKIDMNIADTNARVIIAFSLTMILAVLTYIAFFKKARSSKSPR